MATSRDCSVIGFSGHCFVFISPCEASGSGLQGELSAYLSSSVRPSPDERSSTIFQNLLLPNHLTNKNCYMEGTWSAINKISQHILSQQSKRNFLRIETIK